MLSIGNYAASNKLLDVSAGQRRCFLCQFVCVPRHVNAAVRLLRGSGTSSNREEIITKTLTAPYYGAL